MYLLYSVILNSTYIILYWFKCLNEDIFDRHLMSKLYWFKRIYIYTALDVGSAIHRRWIAYVIFCSTLFVIRRKSECLPRWLTWYTINCSIHLKPLDVGSAIHRRWIAYVICCSTLSAIRRSRIAYLGGYLKINRFLLEMTDLLDTPARF